MQHIRPKTVRGMLSLGGLLTLQKSCGRLAAQLSMSFEEEMKKMTMRTWMTTQVYVVCPQKSMKTWLKTAVRCQTQTATAVTVIQKPVRPSFKIKPQEEPQEEL